jgi:hypothetical protein
MTILRCKPWHTALQLLVLTVPGVLGMIGWAVWYSFTKDAVEGNAKIGFSQSLVITAWVVDFVIGGVTAAIN